METQVVGLSVDSAPCLKAWAQSLGGITYPLVSDFYPHGAVAQRYGVLRPEGYSERALFVIDKEGIIRYVDVHDIDQQPENEDLFKVLAELEPQAADILKEFEEPEPAGDLLIYCTPWCEECKAARSYLHRNSIPYVEVNIARNRAAGRRVASWNGGTELTPTFNVKGTIIGGWDEDKFAQALKAAGLARAKPRA